MVFCPREGEVLVGTVSSQNEAGIKVVIGDGLVNLTVFRDSLQKGSVFDHQSKCWVWQYNDDSEYQELPYSNGEKIKVMVLKNNIWTQDEETFQQNLILAHCRQEGLGMSEWWETSSTAK